MRRLRGTLNLGPGPAARHARAPARLLGLVVAALAVLGGAPATAGAVTQVPSTITISNVTTPANAPPVTFHLTGPTCGTVPTDFTFQLSNGQSKTFTLCDANPSPVSGRFMAIEDVPPGWTLSDITCDNNDPDPADFLIIDLPAATAKIELSQFNEFKSCTFHNVAPTPPPVTAPPVAPPPALVAPTPPPPPPPPATTVGGVQERSPARVSGIAAATNCATRTVRVTIRGEGMRDVTLFVNGRRVRRVRVLSSQHTLRARVPIPSGRRAIVISARVRFRNGTRARTVTTHARRCAATQVKPNFTG
jgi:hypothetical protein